MSRQCARKSACFKLKCDSSLLDFLFYFLFWPGCSGFASFLCSRFFLGFFFCFSAVLAVALTALYRVGPLPYLYVFFRRLTRSTCLFILWGFDFVGTREVRVPQIKISQIP